MSSITYETIIDEAWKFQIGIMKKYELVESTKWDYYMAKAILQRHTAIKKINVDKASNIDKGNYFSRQIKRSVYLDMAKRLVDYVESHNTIPNTIRIGEKLMGVKDFTNLFSAILVYYSKHGELPKTVNVNSKAFIEESEPCDEVYNYFVKVFGKITCIDDALEKIQGKGYGYYYDDQYSNKESIDRMRNGQGINCTDSSAVFYNLAEALGYTVRAVHVKCQGGDGHIRLQVKPPTRTDNEWIDRDPAAVLDGECLSCIWCGNGTILAYDPQWFLQNLRR